MTQLEFWGCAFISFGLPLAMFIFTIAKDPLRIIVFVARYLIYFKIYLHFFKNIFWLFPVFVFVFVLGMYHLRNMSLEYSVCECALILLVGQQEGHLACKKNRGNAGGGHCLARIGLHPAGWSVCLPLLIFPCTIKSRSSLLAPAHPGGPGKRAVKWLWWWYSMCT